MHYSPVLQFKETSRISSGVSMLIAERRRLTGVIQVSWSAAGAGKNPTTGQLGYQLNLLFEYACCTCTLPCIPLRTSVNRPSAISYGKSKSRQSHVFHIKNKHLAFLKESCHDIVSYSFLMYNISFKWKKTSNNNWPRVKPPKTS